MADTAIEAVLRRDRLIIAVSLTVPTMIAWGYVLWLGRSMSIDDMAMPGMEMGAGSCDMMMAPSRVCGP
jgi:predicted metal-binding membrane protein